MSDKEKEEEEEEEYQMIGWLDNFWQSFKLCSKIAPQTPWEKNEEKNNI